MTDATELAKRAVACKAWKWMPGMMSNWGRVLWVDSTHAFIWERAVTLGRMPGDAVPDLGDPATIGCLLHLVREHWGDYGTHTKRILRVGGAERWVCQWICNSPSVAYPILQIVGHTEAEVLVKALEMEVNSD
jgi:hypothetical protein